LGLERDLRVHLNQSRRSVCLRNEPKMLVGELTELVMVPNYDKAISAFG
jgi:hypothetical protein